MDVVEVTQKVLSIGDTYQIRVPGSDEIVMTVKGKVISATPKLTLHQGGADGAEVALMKGNLFKTKFIITKDKQELGHIAFPLIGIKKTFTLTMGDKEYKADGGFFSGRFKCATASGEVAMEIVKELSWKDRFRVEMQDGVSRELGVLAAVAIDQKFFQEK